ncbi:hypothetical protein ABE236_12265 [Priestia endophytica]|uniref:hypothetical protein n=1 Tax=Priestia endophytica TaxID=135735 RepID=UPI003D2723E6
MKKVKTLVLGSALGLLIMGGTAQASSSYYTYSEKVGAFNGSAYTYWQTVEGTTHNERIDAYSKSVGGDYTIDMRAARNSGANIVTQWARNVGDNKYVTFNRTGILSSPGSQIRLQLSNKLSTPVQVSATGKFKVN